MEFWGVEVESGEKGKVEREEGIIVHISQATLGQSASSGAENGETVYLYLKVDKKKFAIGTVNNTRTTIRFDLDIHCKFKLWHTSTGRSVYFMGHKSALPLTEHQLDDSVEHFTEEVDKEEVVYYEIAESSPIGSDTDLNDKDKTSADSNNGMGRADVLAEESSAGKKKKKQTRKAKKAKKRSRLCLMRKPLRTCLLRILVLQRRRKRARQSKVWSL